MSRWPGISRRLLKLKKNGECTLDLPESIFDLDYPGHYLRRIKSVGLSVDCEASPYTSINCTLTLTGSKVRKQALADGWWVRAGKTATIRALRIW